MSDVWVALSCRCSYQEFGDSLHHELGDVGRPKETAEKYQLTDTINVTESGTGTCESSASLPPCMDSNQSVSWHHSRITVTMSLPYMYIANEKHQLPWMYTITWNHCKFRIGSSLCLNWWRIFINLFINLQIAASIQSPDEAFYRDSANTTTAG